MISIEQLNEDNKKEKKGIYLTYQNWLKRASTRQSRSEEGLNKENAIEEVELRQAFASMRC